MQNLIQDALVMEDDCLADGEIIKNCYGSTLADIIIFQWEDFHRPYEWIESDPELKKKFIEIFNSNAKNVDNIILFMGTGSKKHLTHKKGDIVDYSNRYTSWSTDSALATGFTDPEEPVIFIYEGPLLTFNLNKHYSTESEHILPPTKFAVDRTIPLVGSNDHKEYRNIVNAVLNGKELKSANTNSTGKIIYLKIASN